MSSDLKKFTLGEACNILTGFPFKGEKYSTVGVKVLRGENVTIGNLRWDTIKCWSLPFNENNKYSLQEGDIVIGMDGSRVGKNRAQIRREDLPLLLAQRVARLRANRNFSQDFLFYVIRSDNFESYINGIKTGTSIPHVSAQQIKDFVFYAPNKETQNQIAYILRSIDDKIVLNRETNSTLEAIAQAIFKEWFVDFNYPAATGEMIDSPLGPIPKGWRVVSLTSELDIVYGKNLPTSKLIQKGYPVFGGNGLIGYFDRYIYEEPQVIVACRGAASGKINQSLPKSFVTNNSLVFFIPESSIITFPFLKYFCLNTDFTSYVSGSAQPQLTIEALDYANLLVPDIKLIAAFTKLVSIFESKMRENDIESSTLSTIRDKLLGNLMNGDMDV
jgi:type I restriction enzyme S subunit